MILAFFLRIFFLRTAFFAYTFFCEDSKEIKVHTYLNLSRRKKLDHKYEWRAISITLTYFGSALILKIVSIIWELSDFDCFHFYFINPTKIKPDNERLHTIIGLVIFKIVFYFGYLIAGIKLRYYSG